MTVRAPSTRNKIFIRSTSMKTSPSPGLVRYHQHTEVLRAGWGPDGFYNWRNNFYQQSPQQPTTATHHWQSSEVSAVLWTEFTDGEMHWRCLSLGNKCIHSWPHLYGNEWNSWILVEIGCFTWEYGRFLATSLVQIFYSKSQRSKNQPFIIGF